MYPHQILNWNIHRNEKVCSFHSRSATYYCLPSQHTKKFSKNLPTSTSNSYCSLKHLRNWWFVEQGLDSIKEIILQPSRGRGYWQNFEIKKHKFSVNAIASLEELQICSEEMNWRNLIRTNWYFVCVYECEYKLNCLLANYCIYCGMSVINQKLKTP